MVFKKHVSFIFELNLQQFKFVKLKLQQVNMLFLLFNGKSISLLHAALFFCSTQAYNSVALLRFYKVEAVIIEG